MNNPMNELKDALKLNQNLKCKKTQAVMTQTKYALFDIMRFFLKYSQMKQWFAIVLIIIQMLQILSFPFSDKFESVWKGNESFKNFHLLLVYFKINPFFKGNAQMYYIAYYTTIIIVIFIISSFLLQTSKITKPVSVTMIGAYQVISSLLNMISSVFFIPIAELLFSIFLCEKGRNSFTQSLQCWTVPYIIHSIIGGIVLLMFICMTYLVINLLYELRDKKDVYCSKRTVKADNVLLFVKCLIIITCDLNDAVKIRQIIVGINAIVLIYMSHTYISLNPYYSYQIQKAYIILSLVSSWTFIVLFIGEMTKETFFKECFLLCILGNVLIIIGISISNKRFHVDFMLKTVSSGDELLNQLEEITAMILQKDIRTSQIILQGYVQLVNEKLNDPYLKKYAELDQDKQTLFYLMFHLHNLYQAGISKYPTHIRLRTSFAIFLSEKINRKAQALIEIENTINYDPTFSEEFSLYRLKKLLNEQSESAVNDINILELSELFTNLTYKNYVYTFKDLINTVSHLYIDFWSLLSDPQHDNQEELASLNNLGTKINRMVIQINETFDKMQKIKPYDYEILLYYSHFTHDILSNKEKAKTFKTQLLECGELISSLDENNLCHIDLNSISINDDYPYIIASAMLDDLGIITHISISASSMLGYVREELIGKPIELLLPDIFKVGHQKYLLNLVCHHRRKLFEDNSHFQNFKLSFTEMNFFAKTKARYLMPLKYKAAYFPNDNHKQYFFIKILQDKENNSINNSQYYCYVLTDKNLVLQNFSANAVNLLGLTSESLNNSKNITENIKELSEEILKYLLDHDTDFNDTSQESIEEKLNIKNQIIKAKYVTPTSITWVKLVQKNPHYFYSLIYSEDFLKATNFLQQSGNFGSSIKKNKVCEKNFVLKVEEISFVKGNEGLIFILEPIWHYNLKQKIGNPPLQSLKDIITPLTRKSQKFSLNEIVEEGKIPSRKVTLAKEFSDIGITNKIDKGYIPDLSKKFRIDPQNIAFKQFDKIQSNEYKTILKAKANEKLQQLMKKKTSILSSFFCSSSECSDSNNSNKDNEDRNDSSNSNYMSNSQEDTSPTRLSLITDKYNKKFLLKKEDEYYKVNLINIKFSLYDYTKQIPIEQEEYVKISEVEFKLTEEFNKIHSSSQNQKNSNNEQLLNSEGINYSYQAIKLKKIKKAKEEEALNIQEEILKKEIVNTLNKESIQFTVYLFYFLSLFALILVIIKHIIFLFQSLKFIFDIDESTYLIYSAIKIQNNIIVASYNLRELTLLNLPFYNTSYPIDEYEFGLKLFLDQSCYIPNIEHMKNITTSEIQLTANEIDELNLKGGTFYRINDNLQLEFSQNNFKISTELINMALYHIINTPLNELLSVNKDVFAYLYNSYNSLYIGTELQIKFYNQKYEILQKEIQIKLIAIFIACEILMIIGFFILRLGLVNVSKKNDSYLSIFFDIRRGIILNSLEKCEAFCSRFNSETKLDMIEQIGEEQVNSESEDTLFSTKRSFSSKKEQINQKSKSLKENKHQFYGRFAQAHLGMIIWGTFIFAFDLFYLIKLVLFEQETHLAIFIYQSENIIQKHSILPYSLVREVIFERNAMFCNKRLDDTILEYLTYSFNSYQEEKKKIENMMQFLPLHYSKVFYKINQQSVCHYAQDDDLCQKITDGTGFKGLDAVIIYILDETRAIFYRDKNIRMGQISNNFTYNYTVYGTSEYDKYLPENPNKIPVYHIMGPMYSFNDKGTTKIQLIVSKILFPSFLELINSISFGINDNINNTRDFIILSLSSSIAFVIFIFIFIWIPFIHRINTTIYKTKNMLSIIPIDILASLKNIHTLLDIEHTLSQTEKDLMNTMKQNKNIKSTPS